jgi:hypothetical protein
LWFIAHGTGNTFKTNSLKAKGQLDFCILSLLSKMVEKREEPVTTNFMQDPSVELLTINPDMKDQKIAELKDKVDHQKNQEPVEVFVKDEKEAKDVAKLEAQYGSSAPMNAEEVIDKITTEGKVDKSDSKEWSDRMTKETLKQKSDEWIERTKDLAGKASDKIGEWKEDIKSGIDTSKQKTSQIGSQLKDQYSRIERSLREKAWYQSPLMWFFWGALALGSSYLFYKLFM